MKFVKAFLIWLLITPLAILNGGLRIHVTEPFLGEHIALPLSSIILSVMVFVLAYFLIPKIGICKKNDYLTIGAMWFALTNAFDLLFTFLENGTISDFIKLFDVTTGSLWIIVIIVCFISPLLVAKIRKII